MCHLINLFKIFDYVQVPIPPKKVWTNVQAVLASIIITIPTTAAIKAPFAIVIREGLPVADKNIIPATINEIAAKPAPRPERLVFTASTKALMLAGGA